MAQESRSRTRVWVGSAAAVVAMIFIAAFVALHKGTVEVKTAVLERADLSSSVSTNGKVQPEEDFQPRAPFNAVVQQIYVQVGETVKKGQLLMRLDDSQARKDLAAAEAALVSARAGLKNIQSGGTQDELLQSSADLKAAQDQERMAESQLAAVTRLQQGGAASAGEVAASASRVTEAKNRVAFLQSRKTGRFSSADVASQQGQVRQAEAAVSAAQDALTMLDIRAPFAGTVYALPVSPLDTVSPGEALLDLADLGKLEVHAYFDEPEIGKLANGQDAVIVWEARPDRTWHGHILQAPTTVIAVPPRNVGEAIVSVDDVDRVLLPNTNVTVTVTTAHRPQALSLPREALRTQGMDNFVFRIVDGKLVRTPVTLGPGINLNRVEIASGLKPGEAVAVAATDNSDLTDGLRVQAQ